MGILYRETTSVDWRWAPHGLELVVAVVTLKIPRYWRGRVAIKTRTYRGYGTVWRDSDTGKRVSTMTEAWLADVCAKAKWGRL